MAAIEQGADGFETDLRLTKDGVIVCWHDPTMKRVADCDLVIAESTFNEIRAAYPVLSLVELLEIAIAHRKNLALETKHPVPTRGAIERELLIVLQGYESAIREAKISVSIMSFSWFAIFRLRKSDWNSVFLVEYLWLRALNIAPSFGPSVSAIKELNRAQLKKNLFVWTANTEEQILLCQEKGIDVMMTDRPAFARLILGRQ